MIPTNDIIDDDGEWNPEDLSAMILRERTYTPKQIGDAASFWRG